MMYTCGTCKKELPVEEFYKDQSRPNGIKLRCKACEASRKKRSPSAKKYRETHREEILEKARIKREENREEIARKAREYAEANRDKIREQARVRRANRTAEQIEADLEKSRNRRRKNPRVYKNLQVKYMYGITIDEYESILSRGCEVCGATTGKLCLDHDHVTKKVRGCLCHSCNITLGHFKDDPVLLRKLANYIESHQ